jgi:hypothetical protein
MMGKFIAKTKEESPRTFIMEGQGTVTWFDCRAFAAAMLGIDPAAFECIATDQTRPDAILRWSGHDAGSPPTRHLEAQMRKDKYGEEFGDWIPIARAVTPQWVIDEAPRKAGGKRK